MTAILTAFQCFALLRNKKTAGNICFGATAIKKSYFQRFLGAKSASSPIKTGASSY
jgi:hypothetical protein